MENVTNQDLLKNLAGLAFTARADKWAVEYDADLDSFYWTKPEISPSAKLTKFSDEVALYLTPTGTVEGVFIEYAKNNYVSHNVALRPIFENMTPSENDGNVFTLGTEDKSLEDLLSLMGEKVANEAVHEILDREINLKEVLA